MTITTDLKLSADELNILDKALEELAAELSNNHLPFLGSEGQRKRLFHGSWHDLARAMRRPRPCMFPGCEHQSIPRSHTIQRAGPLSFIAEDSHVVTPGFGPKSRGYSIDRVGLNDASTFPGFCQEHEALFHEFETTGEIKNERDISLQVFRTICREIAVKQIQKDHLSKLRETLDHLVSRKGIEILKGRLGDTFLKKIGGGIRDLKFKGVNKAQMEILECEKELEDVLNDLETKLLPASALELQGKEDLLSHVSITFEQSIPVCLTGVANFWVDDHGKNLSVNTILNVLPSSNQTLVVATTMATHRGYFHTYLQHMMGRMMWPLIMVETWMVRGPDHWFMAPSAWEVIPESRQAKILADMLDESVSIGEAYKTSVFDSVREQLLTLPEVKAQPKQIYDAEASKLNDRLKMSLNSNSRARE